MKNGKVFDCEKYPKKYKKERNNRFTKFIKHNDFLQIRWCYQITHHGWAMNISCKNNNKSKGDIVIYPFNRPLQYCNTPTSVWYIMGQSDILYYLLNIVDKTQRNHRIHDRKSVIINEFKVKMIVPFVLLTIFSINGRQQLWNQLDEIHFYEIVWEILQLFVTISCPIDSNNIKKIKGTFSNDKYIKERR